MVPSKNPKMNRAMFNLWLILAVAIIGLVAILAYGIFNVGKIKKTTQPSEISTQPVDLQVRELTKISGSDDIDVIEQELSATNVESLDQGLAEETSDLSDLQ